MSTSRIPVVCAMVAATYWFFEPLVQGLAVKGFVTDLVIAIVAVVGLIAIAQLLMTHVRRLATPHRNGALTVLTAFTVTTVVGLFSGPTGASFTWIFDYIYAPLEASLLALVAFALVNAALQRMRARSAEAAIVIATAVIVMLGRAPTTSATGTIFAPVADWLTQVPNVAGQRVLLIGAGLAALSTLVKLLLGLERDYLGERRS